METFIEPKELLEPLPISYTIDRVEYRIAYICFCIEYSRSGKLLLAELKKVTAIDPLNIQFGCADWFWSRQVNSYALQVEPDRFKRKDTVMLEYSKALHIEKVRNAFFAALKKIAEKSGGLENARRSK